MTGAIGRKWTKESKERVSKNWHSSRGISKPRIQWLLDRVNWKDKTECLIWPFGKWSRKLRYGTVRYKGKDILTHRAMCELKHGPSPIGKTHAIHSCGKGHLGCVNPHHLRWGNHTDNMRDKEKHGTQTIMHGEKNGWAKLTNEQAKIIKTLSLQGEKSRYLSKKYNVSVWTIQNIRRGKSWRRV